MSNEEPPPYDLIIQPLGIEPIPEQRREVVTTFIGQPQSLTAQEEIDSLAQDAAKMDEFFRSIIQSLSSIKGTEKLRDKWNDHYKEYNGILRESIRTTRRAIRYLNEYVDHVLPVAEAVKGPNDESGRKKAVNTLKAFLNKVQDGNEEIDLDNLEELADQHKTKFAELKNKLVIFSGSCDKFPEKKNVKQKIIHKLKQLTTELNKLSNEARLAGLFLGVSMCGTGALVWQAATLSNPFTFILLGGLVTFATLCWFIKASGWHPAMKTEVKAAQAGLNEPHPQEKVPESVESPLGGLTRDISSVPEKITLFNKHWGIVGLDASNLQGELESFAGSEPADYEDFNRHVDQSKEYYIKLRGGLTAYVTLASATE